MHMLEEVLGKVDCLTIVGVKRQSVQHLCSDWYIQLRSRMIVSQEDEPR